MAGHPYVSRLPDGRYLTVELPEGSADTDPLTGETILQPAAIRLLDRLHVLLTPLPATPTPNRLRLLREGLGLTLEEMAARLDVAGERIDAWEAGKASPKPEELAALERLRQRAARAGVVLAEAGAS